MAEERCDRSPVDDTKLRVVKCSFDLNCGGANEEYHCLI